MEIFFKALVLRLVLKQILGPVIQPECMAAGGGESVDLLVGWTCWSARVDALGMHGGREGPEGENIVFFFVKHFKTLAWFASHR